MKHTVDDVELHRHTRGAQALGVGDVLVVKQVVRAHAPIHAGGKRARSTRRAGAA